MTKGNFKKLIIVFWTIWWLVALWTDAVGVLAHMGLLKKTWAPDTNYPFLVDSLKMYPVSPWFTRFLYGGIIFWSFLSTLAFCRATLSLTKPHDYWMKQADLAFMISLTFWLAFFIGDQFVMKFSLEENHMVQGGFQWLTYLSLYLLPNDETK